MINLPHNSFQVHIGFPNVHIIDVLFTTQHFEETIQVNSELTLLYRIAISFHI